MLYDSTRAKQDESNVLKLIKYKRFSLEYSLAGMCLMFCGLYLVLWAKGKEHFHIGDDNSMESEYDVEKPLLS